jgi:hypothetical protein
MQVGSLNVLKVVGHCNLQRSLEPLPSLRFSRPAESGMVQRRLGYIGSSRLARPLLARQALGHALSSSMQHSSSSMQSASPSMMQHARPTWGR